MGREKQTTSIISTDELYRARNELRSGLVKPEALDGLMGKIIPHALDWDWTEWILHNNRILLRKSKMAFRDEPALMKKVLDLHIAEGIRQAETDYPGLFQHVVGEQTETEHFRFTPLPLPDTSVKVDKKVSNPKAYYQHRQAVWLRECDYAALIRVESNPIIIMTAVAPVFEDDIDVVTPVFVNKHIQAVKELQRGVNPGMAVAGIGTGDYSQNDAVMKFTEQGGVFQPFPEQFDIFRRNIQRLQYRLINAT